MSIACFGDSNTLGFDPRNFCGGLYNEPWCAVLERILGQQVYNLGENGRTVPRTEWEYGPLSRFLVTHPDVQLLTVMLGTNDILMGFPVSIIADRMHALLSDLRRDFPELSLLLIAPPPTALPEFRSSLSQLTDALRQLAANMGLPFAEPGNLQLTFDGVHLSEDAHRLLADKLAQLLS